MKPVHAQISYVAAVIAVLLVGLLLWSGNSTLPQPVSVDPKNASYRIDGHDVVLNAGSVSYFGNELRLDLDGDGRGDSIFLVTDSPGGSGTFYYVVAALRTDAGYTGSNAFFIGDRIAPQNITVDGEGAPIAVNYADRAPGESFAVRPSVGKTLWLRFDAKTRTFVQVEPTFEVAPVVPLPPKE